MRKLFYILIAASFTSTLAAQTFVTDSLFGTYGETFSLPNGGSAVVNTIFHQDDGKIVICGNSYDGGCNCFFNLMYRTDACGQIDSTFGVDGLVKHTFDQRNAGYGYSMLPNGKFIAVGMQSDGNSGSQQFPFIARYNSNGIPDSTFGTFGTNKITYLGARDFVSVYQVEDEKLLCTNGPFMMRFNSDGTVDNTFGNGGYIDQFVPAPLNYYYRSSSVRRNDGKIISVAGVYTGVDNNKYVTQMCYDLEGAIDSTFGTNGFITDYNFVTGSEAPRLFLQSDNKLVAINQTLDESAVRIARYNTDGTLDTSFGTNGYTDLTENCPCRLKYLSKFDDDSFLLGFTLNGIPTKHLHILADGTVGSDFSLNGSTNYQSYNNNGPSMEVGLAMGDNELVMGGAYGGNNFYGSMTLVKFTTTPYIPHITESGFVLDVNVSAPNCTFQWYLNGNIIPNANGSTYTVSDNGEYSVDVTNATGCSTSDAFTVNSINVNNQEKLSGISFYPNPAESIVFIKNSMERKFTLRIYDPTGAMFLEKLVEPGNSNVSLENLKSGMYILEAISGTQVYRDRLIKQ